MAEMGSDKNFLFKAFEQVVMKPCRIDDDVDSKIVVDAESLQFVTLKTVKLSDAQCFMKDLENLVEKLDEAVARIYRYGSET